MVPENIYKRFMGTRSVICDVKKERKKKHKQKNTPDNLILLKSENLRNGSSLRKSAALRKCPSIHPTHFERQGVKVLYYLMFFKHGHLSLTQRLVPLWLHRSTPSITLPPVVVRPRTPPPPSSTSLPCYCLPPPVRPRIPPHHYLLVYTYPLHYLASSHRVGVYPLPVPPLLS